MEEQPPGPSVNPPPDRGRKRRASADIAERGIKRVRTLYNETKETIKETKDEIKDAFKETFHRPSFLRRSPGKTEPRRPTSRKPAEEPILEEPLLEGPPQQPQQTPTLGKPIMPYTPKPLKASPQVEGRQRHIKFAELPIFQGDSGDSEPPASSDSTTSANISIASSTYDPHDQEITSLYRQQGAQYQLWIDSTAGPCPVQPATLTLEEMFRVPSPAPPGEPPRHAFEQVENEYLPAPPAIRYDCPEVGIASGVHWHHASFLQYGWSAKDNAHKWSDYQEYVTEGAIIASVMYRFHGPNWSEVAIAHYTDCFGNMNSLRHIYVANIINKQTEPFLRMMYLQYDFPLDDFESTQYWTHNSELYQTLLGTTIGKAVACLVLAAWPRGTHRIAQIKSYYFNGELQLRFDIETINEWEPPSSDPEQEEVVEEDDSSIDVEGEC